MSAASASAAAAESPSERTGTDINLRGLPVPSQTQGTFVNNAVRFRRVGSSKPSPPSSPSSPTALLLRNSMSPSPRQHVSMSDHTRGAPPPRRHGIPFQHDDDNDDADADAAGARDPLSHNNHSSRSKEEDTECCSSWYNYSQHHFVRKAFLATLAVCYLVAFASFYVQGNVLYGESGLQPARNLLRKAATKECPFIEKSTTDTPSWTCLTTQMKNLPTLIWLHAVVHISPDEALDAIALAGVAVSTLSLTFAFRSPFGGSAVLLALQFALYKSLYAIGQTFLSFQWDILLLETGALAIFLPLCVFEVRPVAVARGDARTTPPHAIIWAVRSLFFKLMLMSGIVKLQSRCPTWLGLTALDYHFATQCIPTPLAQLMHHAPRALLKFGVAYTLFVEGPATLLIVSPGLLRELRFLAFASQALLQVTIMLTGNYNFFNMLTIALALMSSLDDAQLAWLLNMRLESTILRMPRLYRAVSLIASATMVVYLAHAWNAMFTTPGDTMQFQLSVDDYERRFSAPAARLGTAIIAAHVLAIPIVQALVAMWHTGRRGIALALPSRVMSAVAQSAIALLIVYLSHHVLGNTAHPQDGHVLAPLIRGMPPDFRPSKASIHNALRQGAEMSAIGGYGLFRRMTGVGPNGEVARPEVILEGRVPGVNSSTAWHEIEMRFKPGDVAKSLPFVAPHQPRVAWQMWFAALGRYEHNPWLLALMYRLLNQSADMHTNNNEIRSRLLDPGGPFSHPGGTSPDAIRAKLYVYDFVEWGDPERRVWKRSEQGVYLREVTLGDLEQVSRQLQLDARTAWPRRKAWTALRDEAPRTLCVLFVASALVGVIMAALANGTYRMILTGASIQQQSNLRSKWE